ncbi:MAG: hypothetical protein P8099_15735 [Gemmatimonadota bacterium]|jgi:hypothetical protein
MSKRTRITSAAILAFALVACADGVGNKDLVRVNGLVQRGPTQLVCSVDNPCVEPFSAGFTITQAGDSVLHFESGTDGRFTIRLMPGDYVVVPDPDAPVFGQQTKDLKVPARDSVSVTLTFDTGIY